MAVVDTGWNIGPAGDIPLSFTAFDRAARPGLVRYAALLCGSPSTADDLVQDVLVRVHRRWSLISGDPTSYARVAVTREFLSWPPTMADGGALGRRTAGGALRRHDRRRP